MRCRVRWKKNPMSFTSCQPCKECYIAMNPQKEEQVIASESLSTIKSITPSMGLGRVRQDIHAAPVQAASTPEILRFEAFESFDKNGSLRPDGSVIGLGTERFKP